MTVDSLIAVAYDADLPAFDGLLPPLFQAYDRLGASSPLKTKLAEPIAALRNWDRRWAVESIPTSIAVYWGDELLRIGRSDPDVDIRTVQDYLAKRVAPKQGLEALTNAVDKLTADFGSWKTPWGEINRFQRLTGDIVQPFNDSRPSIAVRRSLRS